MSVLVREDNIEKRQIVALYEPSQWCTHHVRCGSHIGMRQEYVEKFGSADAGKRARESAVWPKGHGNHSSVLVSFGFKYLTIPQLYPALAD